MILKLKKYLVNNFEIEKLGETKHYLGIDANIKLGKGMNTRKKESILFSNDLC